MTAQIIGSAVITTCTFGVAMGLMYGVKALGVLRVSKEGELMGLDVFEHGVPAYPEFVLAPSAVPHGPVPHETAEHAPQPALTPVTESN